MWLENFIYYLCNTFICSRGKPIALIYLQKLLTAAQDGIIEDVELCVKNGANLEYTNGSFVSEVKIFKTY